MGLLFDTEPIKQSKMGLLFDIEPIKQSNLSLNPMKSCKIDHKDIQILICQKQSNLSPKPMKSCKFLYFDEG